MCRSWVVTERAVRGLVPRGAGSQVGPLGGIRMVGAGTVVAGERLRCWRSSSSPESISVIPHPCGM